MCICLILRERWWSYSQLLNGRRLEAICGKRFAITFFSLPKINTIRVSVAKSVATLKNAAQVGCTKMGKLRNREKDWQHCNFKYR